MRKTRYFALYTEFWEKSTENPVCQNADASDFVKRDFDSNPQNRFEKRFRFLHNFAVDSLDLFLTPNLRAGIKRIRFRICVRYHTRQTFFFDKFAAVA